MRKRPKIKVFEIKHLMQPKEDVSSQMYWLSETLGLFSKRDKEGNCFKIFLELLKDKTPKKADELADNIGISRSTVIFYLNKLLSKGIVDVKKHSYFLTQDSLTSLIENMKFEIDEILSNAIFISKELEYKLKKES